ncbi:Crp/Fnr family transcriptional regulator [Croceicoccus naphthovorans]|uniref:Crp/Fnr family transcriptional regulator n=1 Tax=Croceicoccus naphthovorans TaxID=1348774 RepID=UPI001470653F|nr:Crp/Fnr family transcriptional regulator [Croceicoccus naphthovorans]MBB3989296.1 CRP-like cAMP-binding protein [Croceicoccus naphthovorans]
MSVGRSTVECRECPLLGCPGLHNPPADKLDLIQTFKSGEVAVDRGGQVLIQGTTSAHVYTVLEGVLIRFRLLDDGRRQIINFLFPGDIVGLQAALNEPMTHGIEALIDARLCTFPRDAFRSFISGFPELSYDLIWLAAKEEAALEEHLVALGQRNARERIAYLALFLIERAEGTCMTDGPHKLNLAVTQSQIADMLGLSLVHTNRSLQTLRREGLVRWTLTVIEIPDMEAVRRYVQVDSSLTRKRPFI